MGTQTRFSKHTMVMMMLMMDRHEWGGMVYVCGCVFVGRTDHGGAEWQEGEKWEKREIQQRENGTLSNRKNTVSSTKRDRRMCH